MKNKVIVTACTLLAMATASAQNAYDAEKLLGNDLNGTARFVGMGGAMGALGGDISVMSSNPAGIGIFRSNDVSVSFGDVDLIARIKKEVSIWNINSFAEFYLQIYGKYEKDYAKACQKFIAEREMFFRELTRISYLHVIPSQAIPTPCG